MSWFTSLFSGRSATSSEHHVAPHEKRVLEEPAPPTAIAVTPPPAQSIGNAKQISSVPERSNRNKIIFGAGVTFFAFSMLITRRSFNRRRLASQAAFYTNAPNHHIEQSTKVNGAMEAVEALNIATVNVLSVAMMAGGGALMYLDINSMDDARRMLRGGLGVDGSGKSEKDAEEEFEEWLASTLARKDAKDAKKKELNVQK